MENCKENKGRNNRIHNVLWLGIRKEMPLVILILIVIFWQLGVFNVEKRSTGRKCIESGGKISSGMCCKSSEDFPNMCLVGPCGCSPENSHEVKICDCGEGKCWNGEECV